MKRIFVIGSGGSGKSTFSVKLGGATGLGVIHLDVVFWRSGWQRTSKDEWEVKVAEMVRGDSWIMDGNFGGKRAIRLKACDTVILLDLSRHICLYRVVKRWIQFRGRSRPDMAEGCYEKVDLGFLSWVWKLPETRTSESLQRDGRIPGKTVFCPSIGAREGRIPL